jgi:hypothetical protein
VPTFDAYDVRAEGYASYADWMQARPDNKMGIADPLPIAIEEVYKSPPPLPRLEEYGLIQAANTYVRKLHQPVIVVSRERYVKVPEPSTWLLIATGLSACLFIRRRKRK